MILDEINATIELYIEGKVLDGSKMPVKNNFIISNKDKFVLNGKNFELRYKQQAITIDEYLSVGTAHVCRILNSDDDGNFLARLIFFGGKILTLGTVHVLVEPSNQLFKENLIDIQEHNLFKINEESYFIIKSSCSEDEDSITEANFSFSIITEEKNIDVNKVETSEGIYYKASKVYKHKNNRPQSNYRLVKGSFSFTNQRKITSLLTQRQLEEIRRNKATYLDAWKEYTKERGEKILDLARKFGHINYSKIERTQNGYKVFLDTEDIKFLQNYEVLFFPADSDLPYYLQNTECSWNDYLLKRKEQKALKQRQKTEVEAEILSIKGNCIEVKLKNDEKEIPQEGFISISTFPEEIQIERQEKAWELINTGNCGIQHLGLLLEDEASVPTDLKKRNSKKISRHVLDKIFSNEPTLKQREAIEVALQTPDIALIQGPPGTGKTTVITAILEMLNEQQDKKDVCAGRVLATSYQHDAVTNMIARLSINSLPTPKFGKKKGEEEYKENIQNWIDNILRRVEENGALMEYSDEILDFSVKRAEYQYKPSIQTERALLKQIISLSMISPSLLKNAQEYLVKIDQPEISNKTSDILRKIRAIRLTYESYLDDGTERLQDLIIALEYIKFFDVGNEHIKKILLDSCQNVPEECNEDFFNKLVEVKEQLLRKFAPKPLYIKYELKQEVVELCSLVYEEYEKSLSNQDKKQGVLEEWTSILENNTQVLEKAIRDCSYVYAATAQQSDSVAMNKQKRALDISDKRFYLYDTVIIDEAARSAPPDLLIPMCKAVKRIILVGDHRQLPQLVDDDICEKLEQNKIIQNKNELGELSLFEKLFERMKSLELKDGIKRTVTLDKQYRTHPVLGNFASSEFYDKHDEHYDSPRASEDFAHSLKGIENKAAVWIDVANDKGFEKHNGNSYIREAEAEIIADKIEEWSNSEAGQELSYGVIAFYKAQVEKIREIISRKKINLSSDRLRIGTVDAFQGLEFDVVFLSVVRSNKNNTFGFLQSVNRLCVSMTRQKKVLIVVGDKKFCTSSEARKESLVQGKNIVQMGTIPALAHFADLCDSSEYGVSL